MRAVTLLAPALLLLAACAGSAPGPTARLPAGVVEGSGDPMRYAVLQTAYVFNTPTAVSPAKRAEAAALLEFLAANWAADPRWASPSPGVAAELAAARRELREAFGVAATAAPQEVVSGLIEAARRLEGGGSGLATGVFPDPARTLARLEAPPHLPATRRATRLIEQEFHRIEQERMHQSIGGDLGVRL